MNPTTIVEQVAKTCKCTSEEANEYLTSEVENLRDLQELNDLRVSDFGVACDNLGLEHDYIDYFISVLAV